MYRKIALRLNKVVRLLVIILVSTHSPIAVERDSSLPITSARAQENKYLVEFDFITQTITDCYSYLTIKQQRFAFSFADLTRQFRERVGSCKTDEEYVKTIHEYLGSFHDGHLRLILTASAKSAPPGEPAISNNWDDLYRFTANKRSAYGAYLDTLDAGRRVARR